MNGECQDCVEGECVGESGGGYRAPNCPHLKDVVVAPPRQRGALAESEAVRPTHWKGVCQFRVHNATVSEVRAGGRTFTVCDDCRPLLLAGRADSRIK